MGKKVQEAEKKPEGQSAPAKKKKVALALQGGGSHGAFTWGVIDALLEDGRFEIEGLSGTSAGGMNCVAYAYGMMEGGPEGARKSLLKFWRAMSEKSQILGMSPTLFDLHAGTHGLKFSPHFHLAGHIKDHYSPYDWNPKNLNLLREIIDELFDMDKLAEYEDVKVFLCATNVRNAKLKIFTGKELSVDAMMASACLPTLFHAVTIEHEDYWDGGFIGNPAIFPLIYNCETSDVIVILLTPQHRHNTPKTVHEIKHRLMELSLINALNREMRSINFITKLIDQEFIAPDALKRVHMHLIENEALFQKLDTSSAMNTDWNFLTHLFHEGKKTGKKWIERNYKDVGIKSSIDLEKDFV